MIVRYLVLIRNKDKNSFNNELGLSSAEVLIAVAFLGIMVFFSYQMLERQKKVVNRANQNVEATTILYDMRKILTGPGCKENFSGYNRIAVTGTIRFLKRLTSFPDGTSSVEETYQVAEHPEPFKSKTGLKIKSFSLNPRGLGEKLSPDKTYLVVHFDRTFAVGDFKRHIRLYTQETNGVITNCSLVPFARDSGGWAQEGRELKLLSDKLGVGTSELKDRLNIKGGLYATPPAGGCNKNTEGTLYFEPKKSSWVLCTRNGLIELRDKRSLP